MIVNHNGDSQVVKMETVEYDPSLMGITEWGVFCDWKLPTASDWELIEALDFNDVIIGVKETSFTDNYFNPVFNVNRIVSSIDQQMSMFCGIHLMIWGVRNLDWVKRTIGPAVRIAVAMGANSLLIDWEKDGVVNGVSKHPADKVAKLIRSEFDQAIEEEMNRHPKPFDVPYTTLGVATYIKVPPSARLLVELADYAVPMAYSFWKPGSTKVGSHWSRGPMTFPGVMQKNAFDDYCKYTDPSKIIMGGGNYNGKRPKNAYHGEISHVQSMRMCNAEVAAICPRTSVWWWSLKHFKAKSVQGEQNRRFFGVQDYYK